MKEIGLPEISGPFVGRPRNEDWNMLRSKRGTLVLKMPV